MVILTYAGYGQEDGGWSSFVSIRLTKPTGSTDFYLTDFYVLSFLALHTSGSTDGEDNGRLVLC